MLRLHNDLTGADEPFHARDRRAGLYVCGITPYDATHLGHAFTYCSFDVLVRYLEQQGIAVRYVQNVTDVDDDILRKARETGEDWYALGNRWVRRFIDDMEALNVRPPDAFPRASEAIADIIETAEALVARGFAYVRNGSVYYRAALAPFGSLSGLAPEEWLSIAGQRGNKPDDPNKESPLDFVLWQAQAPGEPAWPSPWGPGRPGWHIECSALSARYLGPTVDIHGGGADLSFPHHECEIAQSEARSGRRPFARFWLHTGMVEYQGAKMSKSLGNLVMVDQLLQDYPPDALRLYLAMHHYREPWSYEETDLARAARMVRRWRAAAEAPQAARVGVALEEACRRAFTSALADDLDTPRAIAVLDQLVEAMSGPSQKGEQRSGPQVLRELAAILGLRLGLPGSEARVTAGWEVHKQAFA